MSFHFNRDLNETKEENSLDSLGESTCNTSKCKCPELGDILDYSRNNTETRVARED